jgi:hypothetical protein
MNPDRFCKEPTDYREAGNKYLITLMIAILLVVIIVISVELWHILSEFFEDRSSVLELIGNLGKWSPIGMIVLQAAQVVIAPIPGQVLDMVNGYLIGPLLGSIFILIGIIIGSVMAMWLARRFGRPLVERFVKLCNWGDGCSFGRCHLLKVQRQIRAPINERTLETFSMKYVGIRCSGFCRKCMYHHFDKRNSL